MLRYVSLNFRVPWFTDHLEGHHKVEVIGSSAVDRKTRREKTSTNPQGDPAVGILFHEAGAYCPMGPRPGDFDSFFNPSKDCMFKSSMIPWFFHGAAGL